MSLLLTDELPSVEQLSLYQQWLNNEHSARSVLKDLIMSPHYQRRMNPQDTDRQEIGQDTDNDGISDSEEFVIGTHIEVKDNDVLGNPRQFVSQVLRDLLLSHIPESAIDQQVAQLNALGSRSLWLAQFIMQVDPGLTEQRLAIKLFTLLNQRSATTEELRWWPFTPGSQPQTAVPDQQRMTAFIAQILASESYQARFY